MKIVVLNGSPKGDISVTMQYVHFLQKKFPQHDFKTLNIALRLPGIEKAEATFTEIIDEIKSADGVLWAFPLYIMLVHANYKRFIELIFERGAQDAFKGKYAAALSTSIHFYDHTAHNYINAICDDLNMKYLGSYSADMYDLMEENKRKEMTLFGEHFLSAIENKASTVKNFQPLIRKQFEYLPGKVSSKIDAGDKKVLILTDSTGEETNLSKMVQRFSMSFSGPVEVVNLKDIDIKGGCLGCLQCGYDYNCFYGDKDGYMEFFNTKLKPADVLVFAGNIRDRYLSSRWKQFFDRSFFNTHTPTMVGKQVGLIVSGPLSQIPNIRQIFEAWFEFQQSNLVDFLTDEYENSVQIDELLQGMAERAIRYANDGYKKPATFLGVAGTRIFRDDIYGRLRFPFIADHKYYRSHGIYDFPQKDVKAKITNTVMQVLIHLPSMRKEIYSNRIKTGMIKPFEKILRDNQS